MLLLLLLAAAIWPKYHSGNWALRYNSIVIPLNHTQSPHLRVDNIYFVHQSYNIHIQIGSSHMRQFEIS